MKMSEAKEQLLLELRGHNTTRTIKDFAPAGNPVSGEQNLRVYGTK
jgi:hypothetical protein